MICLSLLTSLLRIKRARATCTIPTIFRDFRHLPSTRVYHGGNPEYINPAEVADMERKLIWPDTEHYPPDIIISIGAGQESSSRRPPWGFNNWWTKLRSDDRVVLDPSQSSSHAQDTWERYIGSLSSTQRDSIRYIRLNVPVNQPLPRLDDVDAMNSYRDHIKFRLRGFNLEHQARQLIALCFFFDIMQPPTEGEQETFVYKGIDQTL